MSWRFRKTFKVLPGVKLNLTRHGLSTTLGASPFSINLGPKGVYGNFTIPGTGLTNRQRLDQPHSPSKESSTHPPEIGSHIPPTLPYSFSTVEIRCASTERMSSESLEPLRNLLSEAYDERHELTTELSTATYEAKNAKEHFDSWNRGFLMKRIRKGAFAGRKDASETAAAKVQELEEQLRLTTLATEIAVDREQAEPYYRMRDDFAALSECQSVWSIVSEKAVDRVKERSTANKAVTRDPVSFSLNACDLIQWDQRIPHLPNRTGGDMYVYPGFILYRASKQAFALIDFRDVALHYVSTQFTETDPLPPDASVVGYTWAKANKDGSPDRRFQGNYQIPIAHYGELLFSTPDGLDVRYLCSKAALAERLAVSWLAFRTSFASPTVQLSGTASEESARFHAAYEKFNAANDAFRDLFMPSGKGTLQQSDFTSYMATVAEFLSAANGYVETSDFTQPVKNKFRQASKALDLARTTLEECANSGHLGNEEMTNFLMAIATFISALPHT
jgi:hypothetical protein